ncbi:hypothetical protein RHAL1_00216 [Beijerinckiaceae bacterium RH AL1]|nr:hypothetical protein RHAL8_00213 [Beijerinckiaceae bacterium RH AL8]VVB42492.1 hypothetical protein RHCH11_RHCH11_00213 [Beijerinckiaceae bacterium RH CH11]VVC53336.1 hypothetical protein RHAL1_00216 [Beijerinckiaceae bacterium RH AL1]
MSLNLNELLKPIEGGAQAGSDLRGENGLNSLYFRLKDARAQARTIERANEASDEAAVVPHEWQVVQALAVEALETRTKDIEIAAWLIEALLRLEGFVGLEQGFNLARGLLERYWPEVHSIDEDDAAGRIAPLAGLNGVGTEGALIQPIRMVPLFPDASFGTNALWHWSRVQKAPDTPLGRAFSDARANAGLAAIRARAMEAGAARDAFAALTATLDRLCGPDAPASSHIRNVLDEVLDAYRMLLGGGVDIPRNAPTAAAAPVSTATNGAAKQVVPETIVVANHVDEPSAHAVAETPAPPPGPREIRTREEAFTEMLRIAEFFRHNEPHSPISYALETLVWRGRMSFVDLLEELIPNAENRKQLLQHAGIHANVGTNANASAKR